MQSSSIKKLVLVVEGHHAKPLASAIQLVNRSSLPSLIAISIKLKHSHTIRVDDFLLVSNDQILKAEIAQRLRRLVLYLEDLSIVRDWDEVTRAFNMTVDNRPNILQIRRL